MAKRYHKPRKCLWITCTCHTTCAKHHKLRGVRQAKKHIMKYNMLQGTFECYLVDDGM
jgi:hypothetical protein